jgi:hypothetical protein
MFALGPQEENHEATEETTGGQLHEDAKGGFYYLERITPNNTALATAGRKVAPLIASKKVVILFRTSAKLLES